MPLKYLQTAWLNETSKGHSAFIETGLCKLFQTTHMISIEHADWPKLHGMVKSHDDTTE